MEDVNMREKVENEQTSHYMKNQEATLQETTHNQSPPPPATASPPSPSASPTHEFSFTISLHPQPPPKSTQHGFNTYNNDNEYEPHNRSVTPPPEPLTAIDLSPADDIFFHGHLLPLHLLSHLPISPRLSTNSVDNFTLPMKDILKGQNNNIGNTSFHYHHRNTLSDFNLQNNNINGGRIKPKAKSFSIFSRPKSKKEGDHSQESQESRESRESRESQESQERNPKKKLKLEVAQLIKRYMKMVRPLLSFQKSKRSHNEFIRQPHSFSGTIRSSPPLFSAPASMRTSPANSGVLLAPSGTVSPAISTTSDSTMEELHAAIQAAIAHCKNSIAIDQEKVQV